MKDMKRISDLQKTYIKKNARYSNMRIMFIIIVLFGVFYYLNGFTKIINKLKPKSTLVALNKKYPNYFSLSEEKFIKKEGLEQARKSSVPKGGKYIVRYTGDFNQRMRNFADNSDLKSNLRIRFRK